MKSHVLRAVLLACLLATAARQGRADAGSFFNNLGNSFANAGETIAHGTQAAYSTVKNDTVNAAQATGASSCWLNFFPVQCLSSHIALQPSCRVSEAF